MNWFMDQSRGTSRKSVPRLAGILVLSLACVEGCGSRVPSGTVSGKATVGAMPLTEAIVLLCRSDGAAIAKAVVESSGEFTFAKPVPVGNYRVQIESTVEVTPPQPGETVKLPKRRFPEKYQYSQTSGLTAEVKPGANSLSFKLQ
jgi:hypothetical protein